jgi:hypothetical protein
MKLEAKDLRIGNYLDGRIGFVVVEEIRKDGCMVKIEGSRSSFIVGGEAPCLTPIPLTEEWLVRFGFEKSAFNENVYSNKSIILDKRKLGWLLCDNSIDNLKHIEHVHQLQNLYFALTGEELTLNETI